MVPVYGQVAQSFARIACRFRNPLQPHAGYDLAGVRSRQVFCRRLLVVAAARTGCANGGAVALRQRNEWLREESNMGRRAGFTAESRFFWIRIQIFWKHLLPGLADSHVRETVSFPDLLIRMSGKP